RHAGGALQLTACACGERESLGALFFAAGGSNFAKPAASCGRLLNGAEFANIRKHRAVISANFLRHGGAVPGNSVAPPPRPAVTGPRAEEEDCGMGYADLYAKWQADPEGFWLD